MDEDKELNNNIDEEEECKSKSDFDEHQGNSAEERSIQYSPEKI